MRVDRFITLNVVRPVRRAWEMGCSVVNARWSTTPSLPIFMYHSISDAREESISPYYRTCTSPARFREQMAVLKSEGYQGVTLTEGLAWLKDACNDRCSPAGAANSQLATRNSQLESSSQSELETRNSKFDNCKPVVLTFDDGFRDFYTAAYPILNECGFAATMYLPTAFIGECTAATLAHRMGPGLGVRDSGETAPRSSETSPSPLPPREGRGWGEVRVRFVARDPGEKAPSSSVTSTSPSAARLTFKNRECLTWTEVRELNTGGIEFGSHTVNHPKLVDLGWTDIEYELRQSKSEIEARLGIPCASFAYPYAFPSSNRPFVESFAKLLKTNAFASGVTTGIGRARKGDDPLTLNRLPVNSMDDVHLFRAKLAGDYDWLVLPQSVIKKLKGLGQSSKSKIRPVKAFPCQDSSRGIKASTQ